MPNRYDQFFIAQSRFSGRRFWSIVGIVGFIFLMPNLSFALEYDPGLLNFETQVSQSMWGTGDATFAINESKFLGVEWTDKTATLGGFIGGENSIPNPAYGLWWAAYQAYQALYPGPAPSQYIQVGWWWVPNPAYGAWWVAYQAYQAANPGPAPAQYLTVDTTTGAIVELTTSGKVGIEAGFMVSSGTVDATADFAVEAQLPDDLTVEANTFFNLSPSSTFTDGTIATQSPWIEAYINGVLQLSGSVSSQACLALVGCANGTTTLPTIDYQPEIFSIDPNNGIALLGTSLAGGGLAGGITFTGDVVSKGLKVETTTGIELVNTMPASAVGVDLGNIMFELPNIATSNEVDNPPITSSGSDTVITAQLDVDGIASMAAGVPLVSTDLTLLDKQIAGTQVKIEAAIDLIDVKVGPTIDIFQNFELTPTLMVTLDFSKPVDIDGDGLGPVTSYTGAWDSLPDMALQETTIITPTFWLAATLTNTTGVDFGFVLDLAALSGSLTAQIGDWTLLDEASFGPVWSDSIPLAEGLWPLDLFNNSFAFTGFNSIAGNAFTLYVAGSGPGPGPVPEPSTLLLMGVGLAGLVYFLRRKKRGCER